MGALQLTVSAPFQFRVFCYSLALGFGLGLFYEVFRILRAVFPWWGALVIALQDVLYWSVCGVATFLFFIQFTNGEVRSYALIGEGLGAALYLLTLGRLIRSLTQGILSLASRFLHFLYKIFCAPVIKLARRLGAKGKQLGKKVASGAKKAENKRKFHLKDRRVLLYNLLKHSPPDQKPKREQSNEKKPRRKNRKKAGQ